MTLHIYAFGSICRGDIRADSDVDLLLLTDSRESQYDSATFSIYSYRRISELWASGNPFAWHLKLESRLIHSSSGSDFIQLLGSPSPYSNAKADCAKFARLFDFALRALAGGTVNRIYELSTMFLAIRNFATCYLLAVHGKANFSRTVAVDMQEAPAPISAHAFEILMRARILCTRGVGRYLEPAETVTTPEEVGKIIPWMKTLLEEVR